MYICERSCLAKNIVISSIKIQVVISFLFEHIIYLQSQATIEDIFVIIVSLLFSVLVSIHRNVF